MYLSEKKDIPGRRNSISKGYAKHVERGRVRWSLKSEAGEEWKRLEKRGEQVMHGLESQAMEAGLYPTGHKKTFKTFWQVCNSRWSL